MLLYYILTNLLSSFTHLYMMTIKLYNIIINLYFLKNHNNYYESNI
jgi:hypothetical protein